MGLLGYMWWQNWSVWHHQECRISFLHYKVIWFHTTQPLSCARAHAHNQLHYLKVGSSCSERSALPSVLPLEHLSYPATRLQPSTKNAWLIITSGEAVNQEDQLQLVQLSFIKANDSFWQRVGEASCLFCRRRGVTRVSPPTMAAPDVSTRCWRKATCVIIEEMTRVRWLNQAGVAFVGYCGGGAKTRWPNSRLSIQLSEDWSGATPVSITTLPVRTAYAELFPQPTLAALTSRKTKCEKKKSLLDMKRAKQRTTFQLQLYRSGTEPKPFCSKTQKKRIWLETTKQE